MFYEFMQNNSGGYFEEDENLCHILIIAAYDKDSAIKKAEDLGCYWDGVDEGIDCPCCGDRWDKDDVDRIDLAKEGFDTIEEYTQNLVNHLFHWTTPDARIFYADGTVKEFFKTEEIRY